MSEKEYIKLKNARASTRMEGYATADAETPNDTTNCLADLSQKRMPRMTCSSGNSVDKQSRD